MKKLTKTKLFGLAGLSLIVLLVMILAPALGVTAAATVALVPIWGSIENDTFKELEVKEVEALTDEQRLEYFGDLAAHKAAKLEKMEKEIKEHASKELKDSIKALKKEIDENNGKFMKALADLGISLKQSHIFNQPLTQSEKAQINTFLTEKADEIKDLYTKGQGTMEFTTKVVADMTTGSASNPNGIPDLMGVQSAAPMPVNLRRSIVDALITTIPTSLPVFPYTETVPKDGDYSFVAEGGTKPQVDFKVETNYAQPKKVAAHMILTEEAVTDIPQLQSIATDYLRKKHDLKRQNGILFGDGVGANPTGATTYGRVFAAGDMATAVTAPNFMDVVNACITDIYTTHNYTDEEPYMANLVMVNPVDFYIQMISAKDSQGLPLYPQASMFNMVRIGTTTIMPFEDIPAGKIFVADMSKYNVTNYVPYTVRIGWINDQFITNKFTMVGESRLHAFVKALDEAAFIYDDIDTIKTAITKV